MTKSACCKAPVKIAHGCDSDSGHGDKPCTCTDGTQWYECTKCGNPCDATPTDPVEELLSQDWKKPHIWVGVNGKRLCVCGLPLMSPLYSPTKIKCPACYGDGKVSYWNEGEKEIDTCGRCNGKGIINLPTETVSDCCVWCGKTYEEHRDKPFPNGAVAKTPCGIMKSGFCPKLTQNPPTEPNDLQSTTQTINTTRQKPEKTINTEVKQQLTPTEPMGEKKPLVRGFDPYLCLDDWFPKCTWDKSHGVLLSEILKIDVVQEYIAQSVQEAKAEERDKVIVELEKLMPEDSDDDFKAWKLTPDRALRQQARLTLAEAIEKVDLLTSLRKERGEV